MFWGARGTNDYLPNYDNLIITVNNSLSIHPFSEFQVFSEDSSPESNLKINIYRGRTLKETKFLLKNRGDMVQSITCFVMAQKLEVISCNFQSLYIIPYRVVLLSRRYETIERNRGFTWVKAWACTNRASKSVTVVLIERFEIPHFEIEKMEKRICWVSRTP